MKAIPKKFRALVVKEVQGKFIKSVQSRSIDSLPDHDVLIKVSFSSLNYKDVLSATGNKNITKQYPFTPGIDAAGIVAESRDIRFLPGDRVIVTSYDLGMNTSGGFGEYIRVPGDWIVPLPKGLTLKESMIIGTSGLTAGMGAEKLEMYSTDILGKEILVTGATGAVGSFAIALYAKLGYNVIAATGKVDGNHIRWLKKIGASEVIHRKEIITDSDKPLLSSRWPLAFDTVGGEILDVVIRQTHHNELVVCCGNVLGHELNTNIYPFILRGISLLGIDSGIALQKDRQRIWAKLAKEWKPSLENLVTDVCPIEELPNKIQKTVQGKNSGTILIEHK